MERIRLGAFLSDSKAQAVLILQLIPILCIFVEVMSCSVPICIYIWMIFDITWMELLHHVQSPAVTCRSPYIPFT